jgi:IS30 family transposase
LGSPTEKERSIAVSRIIFPVLRSNFTLVELKSDYAVLSKVKNKTADLVGRTIKDKPKPLISRVKTLTVDNGKEFANHQAID